MAAAPRCRNCLRRRFDWLAVVILPGPGCERRRIFIVPRETADKRSYPAPERAGRGFFVHKLVKYPEEESEGLADFKNNFSLARAKIPFSQRQASIARRTRKRP